MTKPIKPDLKATVAKVQDLRKKEEGFLQFSQRNRIEAMMVAYDIGNLIDTEVIGDYGNKRLPEFAKLCGFALKTAYNYLYLFRAVVVKPVLAEHSDIPRAYWYALGSSIRCQEDLMGFWLRRALLQFPLFKDVEDQAVTDDEADGTRVMDYDRMQDVCKYLNDLRRELRQDGILYAFQDYELYAGTPSFGEKGEDAVKKFMAKQPTPVYANREPHSCQDPNVFMVHREQGRVKPAFISSANVNPGDESKFRDAIVKATQKLDIITQTTGIHVTWNLGEKTEEILAPHRLKPETYGDGYRMVKWALEKKEEVQKVLAETVETESVPVTAKIVHGKSQEVLKTDAFNRRMIDVVITDPPYGKEVYAEWREETRVEHDESKTTAECAELVGSVARVLIKRELIKHKFIWMSFVPIDWVHVFLSPLLKAFHGLDYKHQILVWNKVSPGKVGGHRTFARQAEAIIYFNIGDRPLNTVTIDGKPTEMHPSILTYRAESKAGKNEFWKPVDLLKHLIRVTTGEQDSPEANRQMVLDPFCGAGSTGVACIECNRDFRLIESHEGQYKSALDNLILAGK